jgi:diguanylate cyclase (GGDEF)-like protein
MRIQELASSKILKERLNLIERKTFLRFINNSTMPILFNDHLERFHKLLPNSQHYPIRSLAIAPLTLDGEIIGSLNQADYDEHRYVPGLDTSLLEELSVKVSICMSNVVAHEKVRALAYWDPLTGVLNRRAMTRVLAREFKRAERYKTPLTVVFMDVDDFKMVNDTYGHDMGDNLLQYVSARLVDMTRETDIVARFAGDEFVIILPNTALQFARTFVARHQAFFDQHPMNSGGISIPVSISSGMATTEDTEVRDAPTLLKKADEMLYRNKKRRRREKNLTPQP